MYSYEIDQYIKLRNYLLNNEEYFFIADNKKSPQINRVKYDAWNDSFYMSTYDNYEWNFKVKKLKKKQE